MQWLAHASPMEPDGSVGFGAAGCGPVPGPPVSARAFGAPFAPNAYIFWPKEIAPPRPKSRSFAMWQLAQVRRGKCHCASHIGLGSIVGDSCRELSKPAYLECSRLEELTPVIASVPTRNDGALASSAAVPLARLIGDSLMFRLLRCGVFGLMARVRETCNLRRSIPAFHQCRLGKQRQNCY
jgi:hypothetical protein